MIIIQKHLEVSGNKKDVPNDPTKDSKLFTSKLKFTDNINAEDKHRKEVPLTCLTKFRKTLRRLLINFEINLAIDER